MSCSNSKKFCGFYETPSYYDGSNGYYDKATQKCYFSPSCTGTPLSYQLNYNLSGQNPPESGCHVIASGSGKFPNYVACNDTFSDLQNGSPQCPFQYFSGGSLYPGAPPLEDLPLIREYWNGKPVCAGKTTSTQYVYPSTKSSKPMTKEKCGPGCVNSSSSPSLSHHRAGCSFQGVYFSPF